MRPEGAENFERLAAAACAAWCVALAVGGLLLVVLGLISGRMEAWHAVIAFLAGVAGAGLGFRGAFRQFNPRDSAVAMWRLPWLDGLLAALFLVASFRAFFWVAYADGAAIKIENASNLGDLALHWSLIRHMAGPGEFWPGSPIMTGVPLTYPIGMDLINAALLKTGVDLLPGLVATGFLGAAATLAALRLWGGWFVVAGFLFNGGLSLLDKLATGEMPVLEWKSLFYCLLVPQRGFLFAFPAGLLLLAEARARICGGVLMPRWISLLLLGAMPLFHVHTAMFAGGLLVFWAVSASGQRRMAVWTLAGAVWPWAVLLFFVTGGFSNRGSIGWHPGWMQGGEGIWFWMRNFGVFPALAAGALIAALWPGHSGRGGAFFDKAVAWRFVLPAVACFLATCLIRFAPWPWDNTKLMVWSYLTVLPFIAGWLRRHFPPVATAGMLVLLFGSGAATFLGELRRGPAGYELAMRPELDEVAAMVAALREKGRFACAPAFDHPLLLLGHPVALGYPGHLWSHGYNYAAPLEHLERLMNGQEGWRESARALGVRYLFWGLREAESFPKSDRPWASEALVTSPWGNIYDLDAETAGR